MSGMCPLIPSGYESSSDLVALVWRSVRYFLWCSSAVVCVFCVTFLSGSSWSRGICKNTTQVKYPAHSSLSKAHVFFIFLSPQTLLPNLSACTHWQIVPNCSCLMCLSGLCLFSEGAWLPSQLSETFKCVLELQLLSVFTSHTPATRSLPLELLRLWLQPQAFLGFSESNVYFPLQSILPLTCSACHRPLDTMTWHGQRRSLCLSPLLCH